MTLTALLHAGAPAQTLSTVYPDDRSQSMSGKETEADRSPGSAKTSTASSNDSPQIQDNSFLVEEAYNQAFGVVQHIQNFQRFWNSKDWIYTFTQEWPVDASPRHQLSYTLAALHSGEQPASGAGFGDVILNYRYQLLGNGETKVAFAPRLSALLPTGDYRLGRGAGGVGIQGSLPLSVVMTRKLVTHWNVGTTIIPSARNAAAETGTTFGYNFGQSFVWLAHPFSSAQEFVGPTTSKMGFKLFQVLLHLSEWAQAAEKGAFSFTSALNIPTESFQKNESPWTSDSLRSHTQSLVLQAIQQTTSIEFSLIHPGLLYLDSSNFARCRMLCPLSPRQGRRGKSRNA